MQSRHSASLPHAGKFARMFSTEQAQESVEGDDDDYGIIKKREFVRYTQSKFFPDSQLEKSTFWKIISDIHLKNNEKSSTHVERAGIELKVTRDIWDKYAEPSYWIIKKTKIVHRASPRAWGELIFRGEPQLNRTPPPERKLKALRKIRSTHKSGWRIYEEKPEE